MFNVNQITSQLAKMPDQALQQYAAMHKNDPYTVSLALAESNRRKDMRVGATPQPGQMPKVVDQDIAQMMAPPPQQMMPQQARPQMPPQMAQQQLPENTGIGQLPAQNMQGMADGGIVGYADTGLVTTPLNKYTFPSAGYKDPATGTVYTEAEFNALLQTDPKAAMAIIHNDPRSQSNRAPTGNAGIQYAAPPGQKPGGNILPTTSGYEGMGIGQFLNAMKNKISIDPLAPTNVRQTTYAPDSLPTTGTDNRVLTPEEVRKLQISGGREQIGANENWGQINAAPQDGTTKAPPTTGANRANVNTLLNKPQTGGGIDALKMEKDAIDRFKAAATTTEESAVNKTTFLKELSDISKPAFDKANALVDKEKTRLKEGKDQDFYMALIEGGLAAAGESGPNGIQNIAKGFSKGASSYRESLKDFRKATQENAKMEVDISRAEAADKKGDVTAFYTHQEKYLDRKARRDENINSGIAQIINTSEHGKFGLEAARMNKEGHLAAAGISANAQRNLMEALGNAKPDSALRKGFDITKLETQVQKGYEAWQTRAYDKTTGMPNDAFIKMYPTPDAYIQDFLRSAKASEGGGFINLPNSQTANAPIRQR